jgi:hypothetical protein
MKYQIIPGSVINPFGERCFLKYIKGGQTECCFYDSPCKNHIEDKNKEVILDNNLKCNGWEIK